MFSGTFVKRKHKTICLLSADISANTRVLITPKGGNNRGKLLLIRHHDTLQGCRIVG